MEEPVAEATIPPPAQAANPPAAEQSGPSPAEQGAPMVTPTPSSAPITAPAAATSPPPPAAAPQQPSATAREPIAQPGAPPAAAGQQQSGGVKKRKLEKWELQNSTYFKIRAIVRDLRPAFLEVRHTPDFRNCKAADEIRRQLKALLDLSKQMRIEEMPSGKKTIEEQPFVEDCKEAMENCVKVEKHVGADGGILPGVPNQPGKAPCVPEEVIPEAKGLEKQLQGHQGTYVVGGSPMGWNFLAYPGSQPVYYGVTKEAFRSGRSSGN